MAIIQNITEDAGDGSETFPALLVNRLTEGRWAAPKITHVFPGLSGVKHYLDFRKERPIIVDAHLYDRSTLNALYADLLVIEGFTNVLRGLLTIDGTLYPFSTFEGIEYLDTARWDPIHGYRRKCRLFWTQRYVP